MKGVDLIHLIALHVRLDMQITKFIGQLAIAVTATGLFGMFDAINIGHE